MSETSLDLSFEKGTNIWDVEDKLADLERVNRVSVKLPRHHLFRFFKDSWISSFIATASEGRELVIQDWHSSDSHSEIVKRFSASLIGITSAFLANEISNIHHHKFNIDINEIIEQIVFEKNGLIEDSESGKSYVFCSFDSSDEKKNYPKPLALYASTKEEFIKKFLDFKARKIDFTNSDVLQLKFNSEFERELASLIFELYENTNQHGKYDKENQLINGIRSFSLKRHSSNNTKSLLEKAQPFEELTSYIVSLKQQRNLHFYEMSISDNGMGIIDRLLHTRKEFNERFTGLKDFEIVNKIISDNLSSKLYPGSGLGLSIALRNLQKLKGFLSLRTNNLWVYFDGSSSVSADMLKLVPIKNSERLSRMKGTHYNIVVPLS
jgi:hypothetical protein